MFALSVYSQDELNNTHTEREKDVLICSGHLIHFFFLSQENPCSTSSGGKRSLLLEELV